jgi:hypothetical protein
LCFVLVFDWVSSTFVSCFLTYMIITAFSIVCFVSESIFYLLQHPPFIIKKNGRSSS